MSYPSPSQRWSHQAWLHHLAPSSRPSQYRDNNKQIQVVHNNPTENLKGSIVMGDTVTWPAREAELLDIARDDGMDDPGNEPHILPEEHCQVRTIERNI